MDVATTGGFGWLSRRALNALGFLTCAGGLGYAYYAQFVQGFEPCPLCIFQRLALAALGLVFLAATVHDPRGWGAKAYGVLIDLTAMVGAGIAARHVWLQHLPPEEAPRCGPGLDYMLQAFPLGETLREVLTGSGECAKVDWNLLGLSMPTWNLLLFIGLGTIGLLANCWSRR
ncbi:MAG TPA: disulfide bond formation protein B [Candidatus Competibacter sp.]|nr:disulfide bond formation protein B [Candidatus Competibacter sp.]